MKSNLNLPPNSIRQNLFFLRLGLFLTSILALSTLILLTGCNPKSSTDAASEGVFVYASLDEEIGQKLIAAYEKETKEKVQFVRLSTGEAAARLEAEKANPQASLWLGGVGLLHAEAKEKGLTAPYESEATKKFQPQHRDKNGYWNGIYLGILAFAVNTEQLKKRNLQAPQSWQDLLDPKWKGLIQLISKGQCSSSSG